METEGDSEAGMENEDVTGVGLPLLVAHPAQEAGLESFPVAAFVAAFVRPGNKGMLFLFLLFKTF